MKQVLLKLMTALSVLLISASLTPALSNGTVKKECAPKHRKHKPKHHHCPQPAIEEPCYVEPACPTAIPPCNDLYYDPINFYAGGQFGYVNMRAKLNNFSSFTDVLDQRLKIDNGVIGEILGGYRYFWSSGVNLGIELAANLESTSLKKQLNAGQLLNAGRFVNVKFKRQYSFVPAITVGRVYQCRWNFFAKLGLGISRFESKLLVIPTGAGFTGHKTKMGVVPSMGMEYAINNYLSVIGTLTYEYYDKVGMTFTNAFVNGDNDRFTPKRVQYVHAKAGFIAKF